MPRRPRIHDPGGPDGPRDDGGTPVTAGTDRMARGIAGAPAREPAVWAVDSDASRLLHVFPGFGIGGVELRMVDMMNRLGEGYRHGIIALDGNYAARGRLDPLRAVTFPLGGALPKSNPVRGTLRARGLLASLRPELLLTYNWGSIEWALANRLRPLGRHVHFESGFGAPDEAHIRRRILLRRLALGRAERIVVPSAVLYDLATGPWRLPAARVVHVPNGVDLSLFDETPDPGHANGIGMEPGTVTVGTVTSLRPEKNLGRLIRAFGAAARDRKAKLVIVGDGRERTELEAAVAAAGLGGRVQFTGFVDAPHRIIAALDIYAISSDTEQMPNALVQAMAAGLPVVATDVGDIKRIVAEPNRPFVVQSSEEASFAARLGRLMDEPETRRMLGRANRARARERYDIARMVAAYRAIFDGASLLGGQGRPDDA